MKFLIDAKDDPELLSIINERETIIKEFEDRAAWLNSAKQKLEEDTKKAAKDYWTRLSDRLKALGKLEASYDPQCGKDSDGSALSVPKEGTAIMLESRDEAIRRLLAEKIGRALPEGLLDSLLE